MVADQGIGRRLSDGGLGQYGDPSRISLGGATGYYVDEQGMPLDIHQWPPQKPSVKAEYERPFKYDNDGNITETLTVLLPSTPNKDAKWLRRGFLRKRYVDPRAVGVDILPRFNQGLGERRVQKKETLAEFHARREEQRIRAEIDRERFEAELGKDESDADEPVEIVIPTDVELAVAIDQPEDSEEVRQLKRELEVARKTLEDVLAKGIDKAIEMEPIHQATAAFQESGPNPVVAGDESQKTKSGYAIAIPDAPAPEMTPAQVRMAKARAARKAKQEAA